MSDLKLERLEVLPPQSMAKLGETKQIKVLAHFGGNRIEDVTRWAKFTSTQETVAQVDDSGLVRVIGSGAGAISVWYLSQIAVAHVTVPWTNPTPTQPLNRLRSRGFIDDQINAKLVELNLPPSPLPTTLRSSDAPIWTLWAHYPRKRMFDPSSPTAAKTAKGPVMHWSSAYCVDRNLSITGLTSGVICCWLIRELFPRKPLVPIIGGYGNKWNVTRHGMSLPAIWF